MCLQGTNIFPYRKTAHGLLKMILESFGQLKSLDLCSLHDDDVDDGVFRVHLPRA